MKISNQFKTVILLLLITLNSNGQKGNNKLNVRENIDYFFNNNVNVRSVDFLFRSINDKHSEIDSFISSYISLKINAEILNQLFEEKNDLLRLNVPVSEEEVLTLNLVRYALTTNDTLTLNLLDANSQITGSNKIHTGYHYRGIIENYAVKNWCTFSLFKDEVSILIASENGNINIGRLPKKSDYIVYNDRNVKNVAPFECGASDDIQIDLNLEPNQNSTNSEPQGNTTSNPFNTKEIGISVTENCPVSLKWVFDYSFYLGSMNSGLTLPNYITSLFNNVGIIYQNENIPLFFNNNTAWLYYLATPTFVNYNDPTQTFYNFGNLVHQPGNDLTINENNDDDLAMFIQTNILQINGQYLIPNLTSIAVVDAFCTNYSLSGNLSLLGSASGKFALSSIEPTWLNFPYYSWPVNVVSHEMGHNFGSRHTHWCGWPGGPIDACVNLEPNNNGTTCFSNYLPSVSETSIMSYCHQLYGSINLLKGFGPLPGNKIRERYMESCYCRTVGFEDVNNTSTLTIFPNPANKTLNLNLEGITLSKGANLRIFNSNGEIVLSTNFNSELKLDISFLPDGIYFLNLLLDKNTHCYNSRFIVIH